MKETNPKIQVIGVQWSKLASMKAAIEKGELVTLPAIQLAIDRLSAKPEILFNFEDFTKHLAERRVVVGYQDRLGH